MRGRERCVRRPAPVSLLRFAHQPRLAHHPLRRASYTISPPTIVKIALPLSRTPGERRVAAVRQKFRRLDRPFEIRIDDRDIRAAPRRKRARLPAAANAQDSATSSRPAARRDDSLMNQPHREAERGLQSDDAVGRAHEGARLRRRSDARRSLPVPKASGQTFAAVLEPDHAAHDRSRSCRWCRRPSPRASASTSARCAAADSSWRSGPIRAPRARRA